MRNIRCDPKTTQAKLHEGLHALCNSTDDAEVTYTNAGSIVTPWAIQSITKDDASCLATALA